MRKITAILILLTLLMAAGCSAGSSGGTPAGPAKSYEDIQPSDARARMQKEKGIILLDVRTREEYDEKHIPGSLLIPVDVIEKEAPAKLSDKNAVIFVYCRSGNRSVTASKTLAAMGYSHVYNLGGINSWPYDTESTR